MKWTIKLSVQRALGAMPAQIADPIYHGLQRHTRGIPTEVDGQRSFAREVVTLVERIRGKTLTGLRVVELGSGWYPVLPLLLVREFGALEVCTVDANRHYSSARIAAAAREIMEAVEPLRGDPVLGKTASTGRLPDSIRYFPRSEVQDVAANFDGPVDLALSRSVVEYIPPKELFAIHVSSKQWMTQDALWVHLIGTSDDRARHDDKLHPFDFLRYSEEEWMRISGNRYAYKNRLRLPEYRTLFQSAGWRVEHEEASVSDSAIATLSGIPIHPDFQRFSDRELVAGAIRFALSRAKPK